MTAFIPQIDEFSISVTKDEQVWLECANCGWDNLWDCSTSLADIVELAVTHYDEKHR